MNNKIIFCLSLIILLLNNNIIISSADDTNEIKESIEKIRQVVADLADRVEALETAVQNNKASGGDDDADADVDESDVVVLNGDNFDAETTKTKITLVEFYAPWCGHCKALKPHYAKAATALKDNEDVTLAKIDCTADENKDACNKFDVKGFPTMKLIRKDVDEPLDYEGQRTAADIVEFMEKALLPAVTDIESAEQLKEFTSGKSVTVVAYIDASSYDAFKKVAETLRNSYNFAAVQDSKLFGDNKAGTYVVYRSFDDPASKALDSSSDSFTKDLKQHINEHELPLLGELTMENYRQYYERGLNFVWSFVEFDNDKQTKLLKDAVEPVAEKNRDLSFVKMDGKRWGEHATNLGASGIPAIILEDRENGRNYVFDKEFTLENVEAFINGYKDGSLKPHMKSEEIPEKNDEPVTVVVGKSYDDIVLDENKDVLLEFYAPWCGHCKALEPAYNELGKAFENDKNVVIAKIDATANDTPQKVEGFPTIMFFPAGEKKPVPYEGGRTKEAMAEFISENRKSKAQKDEL